MNLDSMPVESSTYYLIINFYVVSICKLILLYSFICFCFNIVVMHYNPIYTVQKFLHYSNNPRTSICMHIIYSICEMQYRIIICMRIIIHIIIILFLFIILHIVFLSVAFVFSMQKDLVEIGYHKT